MSVSSHFAKTDTGRAVQLALTNRDAWSVCQDLAWALRFAPEPMVREISETIARWVPECRDDYQRSAVRAWQVRALVERGRCGEATVTLSEALAVAAKATPYSSRSDALLLLLHAACPFGAKAIAPIARDLLACREPKPHWRVLMNLVRAMELLSTTAPDLYRELRETITEDRLLRRIDRAVQRRCCGPREFFW